MVLPIGSTPMVERRDSHGSNGSPIGRDHEHRILCSALDAARLGQGRLILVGGEAGIGKTTIVEHFVAEARTTGATVLAGACYDVASPPPYAVWRAAFASGGESAQTSLDWLEDEHLSSLPDQMALFKDVQQRLEHLASLDSVVLLIEDIHWSDREGLELLRFLARSTRNTAMLVIATYRNDEITPEHPLYHALPHLVRESRAERLDLRRFSRPTIGEMVETRYQLEEHDRDRLVDELLRRTEGNPFFIVELLRSMEMSDILYVESGRWRLAPLSDIEIPALVRQVIDRRFLQLDASARVALQAAAVVGYEVRPDLWLAVIDEDEFGLSRITQQALDAFLLEQVPNGIHLRFRHALVHEALYSSVPLPWRQVQHRRIAETLLEKPDADSATVAEHFRLSGDLRANEWSLRAARQARQLYAPYAIVQSLNPVLESHEMLTLEERTEAFRLRGWAHEISGEFDAACRDYLAELRTAIDGSDRYLQWDALIRLAELWAGRDYERASQYVEQSLRLAQEINDQSLTAYSLNRMGNWYLNSEDPDRAREYHEQALRIFENIGDQQGLSATYDLLGMTCYMGGDIIEGTRHYERAIDLFQLLDNRQGLASSLANFSMRGITYHTDTMAAASTTLDDCIADAERALEVASEIDFRAGEVYALIRLGSCLGSRGKYKRAVEVLQRSITGAGEIGHRQWLTAAYCVIGATYLDMLDPQTAFHYLEPVGSIAEETGSRHWIRFNSGIKAMAHIAMGELDEAETMLRSTWTEQVPAKTMAQRHVWRARIELELAQGNPEEAILLTGKMSESAAHIDEHHPAIQLSLLHARALIATERCDEALSWLVPARRVAREQGARPVLWRIYRELGRTRLALGHRRAALGQFAEARQVVGEIANGLSDAAGERFQRAALSEIPGGLATTKLQAAKLNASGLTRRQREVAVLIASGRSNREIADELSISERTVESHVTSILATLSLNSRAQLAAWCVESGLTARPLQ